MTNSLTTTLKCAVFGLAVMASGAALAGKVTLTTQGSVAVKPDLAHISLAVETQNKSAKIAVQKNSEKMIKVLAALKAKGVKEDQIKTTNFSVYAQRSSGSYSKTPSKITGYRVTNTVHITTDVKNKLGEVLDNALEAGANRISGISFSVKEADKFLDKARQQAMKTAIEKVKLYAEASGKEIGDVISISENRGHSVTPVAAYEFKASRSVPIQSGTQNLTVNVTVTWELK